MPKIHPVPTDVSASPSAEHEHGGRGGGDGLCGDGGLGRRRSRGRREERREDAPRRLAVSHAAGEFRVFNLYLILLNTYVIVYQDIVDTFT